MNSGLKIIVKLNLRKCFSKTVPSRGGGSLIKCTHLKSSIVTFVS